MYHKYLNIRRDSPVQKLWTNSEFAQGAGQIVEWLAIGP